jgi:hypothetical protein
MEIPHALLALWAITLLGIQQVNVSNAHKSQTAFHVKFLIQHNVSSVKMVTILKQTVLVENVLKDVQSVRACFFVH